jgi:poly(A) polymerase
MALSRERIADELLKLLALPAPAATVRLMVGRGILKPVLPQIDEEGAARLERLTAREAEAGVAGDPVRRLAALLPADPEAAASVAARLRLSNRAAKRLAAAAARPDGDEAPPLLLAYRLGRDEAVDRILLGQGDPAEARALEGWEKPRLAVGGGDLIRLGLQPGPIVARTLQAIEREWSEKGFAADKEEQKALARRHVEQALRQQS